MLQVISTGSGRLMCASFSGCLVPGAWAWSRHSSPRQGAKSRTTALGRTMS